MSPNKPRLSEYGHPTIGTVSGQLADGVVQFLGLKYASLRHWFDNAQPCTYDGSGITAHHYGPQAISTPQGLDNEFAAIQKPLPKPEPPIFSGTDCLNLNISVPEGSTSSSALPVLVYIHGGGFAFGSSWWPQFDMHSIVQLSVKLGKPIIGISINYRLGAPGFMTSEELQQAGYQANRGLQDQRLALRWVNKHIAGFGGDAARVTVAGESAGGLSTTRLMYTEETLASRIIVMGGAPPLVNPLSPSVAEFSYRSLIETYGYQDLSRDERLKALAEVSISKLQEIFQQNLPFIPVLDDNLVPYNESFKLMASKDYVFKAKPCEAAMVVFSTFDASIFAFMGLFAHRQALAVEFANSLLSSMVNDQSAVARLLQCYDISPDLDDETALLRILQFGSDIGHQTAARALAEALPCDAFVMQFSEPNPWEGPFKGYSTHILDIAFLLQNYNGYLNVTQRAAAGQFAEDVLAFVYGQKPWKAYSDSKGISVLKDGQRKFFEGPEAITRRYSELLKIGEVVGLDALLQAWTAFAFPAKPRDDKTGIDSQVDP